MKSDKKIFSGKTLAILTGGGDTSALNSSIEAIRNRAQVLGYKVYGIRKGWKGLLGDGDIVDLTNQHYDGWHGGTALNSSRTNPFPSKKNPENRVPQILKNLQRYKIDVLVSIGGDDTNGAAKKLFETEGIPVIGFPKTIDNDLRTRTIHSYKNKEIEAVVCPGFPSAADSIAGFANRMRTTVDSHSRIAVLEIMGRDAGWLTGSAIYGGADIALIPEFEITKERKEAFFNTVKEKYNSSRKKSLIIAISEGVRWYDENKGKVDMVYASSEVDEFGHALFGGISGVVASEISRKLGIEARAQITGYYARAGRCGCYDRRLTQALADKVTDLLLRNDYGQMPVLSKVVKYEELEEFNTKSIDMGDIGNRALPDEYYDVNKFNFTEVYFDFISNILGSQQLSLFNHNFPTVKP
ncbi:MAG: 6-phosphofructokinase [Bacteroidales bacterium]|jgi:6-phosphofructokinase 1